MALGTGLPPFSRVSIATDTRTSGPVIKDVVTSSLLNTGINVTDLGILPTPALAMLTREMNFDAGIMITASHNPAEYNGIKLFNWDGIGYGKDQEAEIEKCCYRGSFRRNSPIGKLDRCNSARNVYFQSIMDRFADIGLNKNIKVVIDPGNGAAAGFASELFSALKMDVTTINDTLDGTFPNRNPEPRDDTLQVTIELLRKNGSDLAICFDGDADRVVFCDREGFLGLNEMIAFISRIAIGQSNHRRMVATVDTGRLVDMALADLGVDIIRSEIGDVNVAHLTRQTKASIGVEPAGIYIQPEQGYFPDPIFAALTLLSHIKDAAEIREFFKNMPQLHFSKSNVPCPDHLKAGVIDKLIRNLNCFGAKHLGVAGGFKLEFEDSWMLIRASGTEPAIRVIAESASQQQTTDLLHRGSEIIADALKRLTS